MGPKIGNLLAKGYGDVFRDFKIVDGTTYGTSVPGIQLFLGCNPYGEYLTFLRSCGKETPVASTERRTRWDAMEKLFEYAKHNKLDIAMRLMEWEF